MGNASMEVTRVFESPPVVAFELRARCFCNWAKILRLSHAEEERFAWELLTSSFSAAGAALLPVAGVAGVADDMSTWAPTVPAMALAAAAMTPETPETTPAVEEDEEADEAVCP